VKVGDMVRYKNLHGHVVDSELISNQWTGIVLEERPGSAVKVFWSTETISEESKSVLEQINESR
jgi:hypothetical protein